jgi:hypothetical protein
MTRTTGTRRIFRGRGMSADVMFVWANWALVVALVLGVAATWAIVVSGTIKEERLKRELAAQNERAAALEMEAATARLEQERLKEQLAWRSLSKDKTDELVLALSTNPGVVNVKWVSGDPEAHSLAIQLTNIFDAANWRVGMQGETRTGTALFGLWIPDPPTPDAPFVRSVFTRAGIAFESGSLPRASLGIGSGMPTGTTVFVGSKPPPR